MPHSVIPCIEERGFKSKHQIRVPFQPHVSLSSPLTNSSGREERGLQNSGLDYAFCPDFPIVFHHSTENRLAGKNHIDILNQGVGIWNEWRTQNPDIIPDLSAEDLTGRLLSEVDFSRAILKSTLLTVAELENANLNQADLTGGNLTGADLNNATAIGANFTGVDLSFASLAFCNLDGADLTRCRLSEAILFNASLKNACLIDAHLRETILTGSDLSGADMTGAHLLDIIAEGAILPIRMPVSMRKKTR